MFLAELHADRAIQPGKAKERDDAQQSMTLPQPSAAMSPSRPGPPNRLRTAEKPRKAPSADRPRAHFKAATVNLGLVLNALIREREGPSSGSAAQPDESLQQMWLRYHWALGCSEEHRGHYTEAMAHLQECLELCDLLEHPQPPFSGREDDQDQHSSEAVSKLRMHSDFNGQRSSSDGQASRGSKQPPDALAGGQALMNNHVEDGAAKASAPSSKISAQSSTPPAPMRVSARLLNAREAPGAAKLAPSTNSAPHESYNNRVAAHSSDDYGAAITPHENGHPGSDQLGLVPMEIDGPQSHGPSAAAEELERHVPFELRLANCKENQVISKRTLEAKLEGLELLKLLASARKLMEDGHAEGVVKRLEPLVGIGEPLEGLSSLSRNPRAYLQALTLLQVQPGSSCPCPYSAKAHLSNLCIFAHARRARKCPPHATCRFYLNSMHETSCSLICVYALCPAALHHAKSVVLAQLAECMWA
jgi:hypothetical protein